MCKEKWSLNLFIHRHIYTLIQYSPSGLRSLYFDVILPVIHTTMNDFLLFHKHIYTDWLTRPAAAERGYRYWLQNSGKIRHHPHHLSSVSEEKKVLMPLSRSCLLLTTAVSWSSSVLVVNRLRFLEQGQCVGVYVWVDAGPRLICKRDTVQAWII